MELQHVNVKIFVEGELAVDLERVIEVFHRWTAQQVTDEMLIDVADYRHVPAGPGVVLIGHEADYAVDNTGNRWGMLYNRKAEVQGSNQDRFAQAFRAAANASALLETEFAEGLKFSRHEFQLFINDRVLAPNTAETLEACRSDLESFIKQLGAGEFQLESESDPRKRFGVTVSCAKPFDLAVAASS